MPGDGQLLFIEHVRSGEPRLARRQDRMNWLNRIVVCCECNRPTLDSIMAAGFAVARVEHGSLPKAPSFVRPLVTGSANAPVPGALEHRADWILPVPLSWKAVVGTVGRGL